MYPTEKKIITTERDLNKCLMGIIYYTKVQQPRIKNVFKYIYYNRSILNYKFKVQGRE